MTSEEPPIGRSTACAASQRPPETRAGDEEQTTQTTIDDEPVAPGPVLADHVLRVRLGAGANCSSIGSVVDTLFATAAAGAALFAAVIAAIRLEDVREVRSPDAEGGAPLPPPDAEGGAHLPPPDEPAP